ncbi:ABC transporter permease [Sciscionella marina]|uniref:ABC transporter permease n=1 Tax=Sciscionella marina TaxID=508770 RepID=UPI0003822A63|nr:ABC transporter permease [Sciscionella marina]
MTAAANTLPARTIRIPAPTVLAAVVVVLFVIAAIFPSLLAPYDAFHVDLGETLRPPSFAHPFGTDQSGRDVLSRVVSGAGASLLIGLGATAVAAALAVVLGVAAGLGGRLLGGGVNRLIETLFAFPVLVLALLLITVFGPGVSTLVIAVGVANAPGYARIVRGQVLSVRRSEYVEAAHATGHSPARVLLRHILPNALRPLVVAGSLGIGQAIVWASGLAFLGLGVAPPSAEWGALLNDGRTYVTVAWWVEVLPGAVIVLVALALTALGRAMQRRFGKESG